MVHVIKPEFPELNMGEGNAESRSKKIQTLTEHLLALLPKTSVHFTLPDDLDPGILRAFKTAAFSFQREATFIFLPPQIPLDATSAERRKIVEHHFHAMWDNAKQGMRRKVRQAGKDNKIWLVGNHEVLNNSITPQEFENFYRNCLNTKGKVASKNLALIRRVMEESIKLNQGRIVAAMSDRGIEYAAAIIWGEGRCYYWAAQSRNDVHKGASEFVIFEAIKFAARLGLIFDFDGQADKPTIYNTALGKSGTPTTARKVFRTVATRLTWPGTLCYAEKACRKWISNNITASKPRGAIP
jgi:hypothetical protein